MQDVQPRLMGLNIMFCKHANGELIAGRVVQEMPG